MTAEPTILLTNDDGIDAPGIGVLADELVEFADVTVLAPATNQSGVGRTRSWESVSITEHELGHAVDGTPVDCVVAGVAALETDFDLVVSGINTGPNVGAHVLGRSGTVGAAVEAGFFGLPAIAVSMYGDDPILPTDPDPTEFEIAAAATRFLVSRFSNGNLGSFPGPLDIDSSEGPDYLNVNAPSVGADPAMRLTYPSMSYELGGTVEENEVRFNDVYWDELGAGTVSDPVGTDRRAVVDGEVSVSPLSAPKPDLETAGEVVEDFSAPELIEQL